jgi:hypothetical protein
MRSHAFPPMRRRSTSPATSQPTHATQHACGLGSRRPTSPAASSRMARFPPRTSRASTGRRTSSSFRLPASRTEPCGARRWPLASLSSAGGPGTSHTWRRMSAKDSCWSRATSRPCRRRCCGSHSTEMSGRGLERRQSAVPLDGQHGRPLRHASSRRSGNAWREHRAQLSARGDASCWIADESPSHSNLSPESVAEVR